MAWTASQPGAWAIPRDRTGSSQALKASAWKRKRCASLLPYSIGYIVTKPRFQERTETPPLDGKSMEEFGGREHVLTLLFHVKSLSHIGFHFLNIILSRPGTFMV